MDVSNAASFTGRVRKRFQNEKTATTSSDHFIKPIFELEIKTEAIVRICMVKHKGSVCVLVLCTDTP